MNKITLQLLSESLEMKNDGRMKEYLDIVQANRELELWLMVSLVL